MRSHGTIVAGVGGWLVERLVHFGPGDLVKEGFVHFGFHDRGGRHFVIEHQEHRLGLIGHADQVEWTVAAQPFLTGVPNIATDLDYPMYADSLSDGSVVVSNLGNARLYRVDARAMEAELLIDGHELGLVDMGNCVVGEDDDIWVNEVTGCRIWRFDRTGRVLAVLGNGEPGFQDRPCSFGQVRFNWIYDLRRGPARNLLVLDSRNFALRRIDVAAKRVVPVAGTGAAGYSGDGGAARRATFGSDPAARFDGPISLAVDEAGNAYVGDRFNHVVRMIDSATGIIETIAGHSSVDDERPNDPRERDPLRLNLPQISSMDYADGRLLVPTDLAPRHGDLAVLRPSSS